jgi:hypothetical protein
LEIDVKNLIQKTKNTRGRKRPSPGSGENKPYWKGWDAAIDGKSPLSNTTQFNINELNAWLDGYYDAKHQMDLDLEDHT